MPQVPTKLGRYEIVKHLASGGMAQVLIARATGIEGFERHVVVKRIHSDHADDPAFVQMFLDEARTAAALHHHNIVQVHDIGKEDGEYFFAMEYVHGQDLRMLLKETARRREMVPWEHIVTIMTAAAAGLHHAHELRGPDRKLIGLVHRDVSPANILIAYDGNVKVVDFGIAKAAMRTGEGTRGGALKGKVSYMAPEQCAGKPIDRRSDVYSFGVVLYELSTVRRLFKCDNDFLTMSAIVAGSIPHPAKHRADTPPVIADIILKALARRPADRFQTADEMREALEAAADVLKLRTSTGALASYMKHMFGAQPEPWLVDEAVEVRELTVDFDGSASGMAEASEDASQNLSIPASIEATVSAPIERARRRITDGPPLALAADGSQPNVTRATGTDGSGAKAEPFKLPAIAIPPVSIPTIAKPVVIPVRAQTPQIGTPIRKPVPLAGVPIVRTKSTNTPPVGVSVTIPAKPATPPAGTPIAKAPPPFKPPATPTARPDNADVAKTPDAGLPSLAEDDWLTGQKPTFDEPAKPAANEPVVVEPPAVVIATEPVATPDKRKRLAIIGGAIVLAIILVIALATRGGGANEEPKPDLPTPARVEPPPEPVAKEPVKERVKEPVTEPVRIRIKPDPNEPVTTPTKPRVPVGAGSGSATPPKRPPPPPPPKKWNPDELFIQ